MSLISSEWGERTALDMALIGLAGLVLLTLIGLGIYGVGAGFIQSTAYYKANDVVSLGCAVISTGCALYLVLELAPTQPRMQVIAAICVVCAMFGFFAVSKGLPAAVTVSMGAPGQVEFVVDRMESGGKGCPATVVAVNAGYEDFRLCVREFKGGRPALGRHIRVRGHLSNWGITREDFRVVT